MLSILRRIYNSIALLPAGIALFFALIACILTALPMEAQDIPDFLKPIVITGKTDVQSILAFIIGGIFTLTIFSYTMVMNVLNRSINNYSPRLIPLILSEKHHQLILGFTSGTIVYSMILSIAVANGTQGTFPPLGASIGVFMSIFCVFLFIYFIHSVSQSIHINYILKKSFDRGKLNLKKLKKLVKLMRVHTSPEDMSSWESIKTEKCGYLQLPDFEKLAVKAFKEKCSMSLEHLPGMFVLEKDTLIKTSVKINDSWERREHQVSVDMRVPLEMHESEIKHLVEVAVKASSPAINDPGTSLAAIDYLTQLLILRAEIPDHNSYTLNDTNFVYVKWLPTQELSIYCYLEMWHYMNEDPILIKGIKSSMHKLQSAGIIIDLKNLKTAGAFV
ncbi:DUF2254 family protein [Nonlabens antarcticus]|uniref:DUF2254 family protein n=1 Tax=Nonlabens antarcticus TaxID=392714 RepID=UPI0018917380|nr:DUF2254 family protein [Nonlabens antarcticus]